MKGNGLSNAQEERLIILKHAKRNETFALYYDGATSPPTYWGCRLYSNRADAQDESPTP